MGAQPIPKRGQIELVPANLALAVEQERHVPAVRGLERRVGVDVDRHDAMGASGEQRIDVRGHVLAQ